MHTYSSIDFFTIDYKRREIKYSRKWLQSLCEYLTAINFIDDKLVNEVNKEKSVLVENDDIDISTF